MKLYNFTNHQQDKYANFFRKYGFDEVTEPMHPEITQEMSEQEIAETVRLTLPEKIKDAHFLVQGMSNVCHYAVTFIHKGGGKAYYIYTIRKRDEKDRFEFIPVDLRKYANIGGKDLQSLH